MPQISVVLGPAAGGAAYGPALTDVVVLGPEGRIFVTGPEVVRSVTGEDVDMLRLGGPAPHGRRSGVVHLLAETEQEALLRARDAAALLGNPGSLDSGSVEDRDLAGRLPESGAAPTTSIPWSRASSTTAPSSSCTPTGPRTSSPPWAASAAAPSASSRTTRCVSVAAWTPRRPRRPPGSCGCATRSESRS